MIFISSHEVKNKCHEAKNHVCFFFVFFFTEFDEIKVIFSPTILILYLLYTNIFCKRREANLTFSYLMFDSQFCPLTVKYKDLVAVCVCLCVCVCV